jgi:hypothetical protein
VAWDVAPLYELVELARVCWRQSQTTWTQEAAGTLRRIAREYLKEAAKLDGGRLLDIGLVCLKEAQQARWEERERGMWGNNDSGWIDARRKRPVTRAQGARATADGQWGLQGSLRPKTVRLGHRAVGRIAVGHP